MKKLKKINVISLLAMIMMLFTSCDTNSLITKLNIDQNSAETISYEQISTENISQNENYQTFDSVYVYRNMLDDDKKEIYDLILSELSDMILTMKIKGYSYDDINEVFDYVYLDHPELFWLTGAYTGEKMEIFGYKSIEIKLGTRISEDLIPQYKNAFDNAVDSIVQQALTYDTEYERVLFVHDYLVQISDYDMEAVDNSNIEDFAFCAYSCIMGDKTVCSGYSYAFQLIMQKLGIPCGTVAGTEKSTGTNHKWNFVYIDGEYYYVDLTWDDPVVDDGKSSDLISHIYFMVTTDDIVIDHTIDEFILSEEKLDNNLFVPECNGTEDNYFIMQNKYFTSFDADSIEKCVIDGIGNGGTEIKFSSVELLDLVVAALCTDGGIYKFQGMENKTVRYTERQGQNVLTLYY